MQILYHYLLMTGFAHIKQLSAQWKNSIVITSNHAKASNCQGFGRISLSQNQSATARILCAGLVGILKLCNTLNKV